MKLRIRDAALRVAAVGAVILAGVAVAAGMVRFPQYVQLYRRNAEWISFLVFSGFAFYSVAVLFKGSWRRIAYWTSLVG